MCMADLVKIRTRRKTITHALMVVAIAILAWSIVNAIINAVTG